MARSISDMQKGDFVKTGPGSYEEIQSVYGVKPDGGLAKPSEGGIGVVTTSGRTIGGMTILRYFKKDDPRS